MLGVAHFGSAQQNEFDTYLLDSIAAVVVGGTSLFGGRGGIGNTIVGLFVLGVLNNGLDHVNIDSFLKILICGLILLAALVINVYAQRLRARAVDRSRAHGAKSGCQSRNSRAALVTARIVGNAAGSSIMVRARRRLRASQVARSFTSSIASKSRLCASPRMRRMILAAAKPTASWNIRPYRLAVQFPAGPPRPAPEQHRGIGVTIRTRPPEGEEFAGNCVHTASIVSSTQASNVLRAPVSRSWPAEAR